MVSKSLNQVLKSLTPVGRADPVYEVASSERINAIQNAIHLITRGDHIVAGHNLRKRSGDGFVVLSPNLPFSVRGGAGAIETPFRVVRVANPDLEAAGDLVGVISNSHVFNSESRDIYEVPNDTWGLLDDDRTAAHAFDPGSAGEKIFLEIELDPTDQSIVSIEVVHGVVGFGLWDNYPDPIEINVDDPENPYHWFFHQIIAEITDPFVDPRPGFKIKNSFGTTVQVTQCLFADLMMTTATTTSDAEEIGLPLLVAIPWDVLAATDTGGTGTGIYPESNLMTPWQLGSQETLNDYNFELFNASENGLAKVLILDGVVYGPNNDTGMDPTGMPSNDTYTIDVADGDEIWVGMTWSPVDPPLITSVWIAHGPSTPDDEEETTYVTIGSVSVDNSGDVPIVSCRNEVCGDIVIQLPPAPFLDNFVLMSKNGDLIWSEVCDATCGAS